MTRAITKAVVGIVLCLSLLLPGLANAGVSFNRIITFGDSLSDPGSYFLLTGDFEVRPFTEPIPDSPYLIGLFHFSNGPTWIERLAKDLCMPASGKSALLFPRVYTNYAVGRSRARQPGDTLTPICKLCDLTAQVNRFLNDFKQRAPSNALYVVFIGSNDLSDALTAAFTDPEHGQEIAQKIIGDAMTSTIGNIQTLYSHGAKKFLVLNLPDFGLTPYIIELDKIISGAKDKAKEASWAYNAGLEASLSALEVLPGIQIVRLNVFDLLHKVVGSFESGTCLTFNVVKGAICPHPDEFLFWDAIHPTTAGHDVLSEGAKEELGIAP